MTNNDKVKTNGSLEDDVKLLNSLLSQENLDEKEEASVAALLQRLESAEGVAAGMENKLDDLLSNLDNLLATLEPTEPRDSDKEGKA